MDHQFAPRGCVPLFTLALCLFGCGNDRSERRPKPAGPAPKFVKLSVLVPTPHDGVDLLVSGKPAGRIHSGASIQIKLDPDTWLSESPDLLTGRIPTTCGSVVVPIVAELKDRAEEEKRGTYINARAKADDLQRVHVWIDNSDGPEQAVKIGQLTVPVAAGTTKNTALVRGTCKEAAQVSVGGKVIGNVQGGEAHSGDVENYLVAAAGPHCYMSRRHRFLPAGTARVPEEKPDVKLPRKPQVHGLGFGEVHLFLKDPPAQMMSEFKNVARHSVVRVPCK